MSIKFDDPTPKPWRAEPTSGSEFLLVCRDGGFRDGQAIAQVYRVGDAALIVAAVNSYDAYQALVKAAKRLVDNVDSDREYLDGRADDVIRDAEILEDALAAIEKVEKGSTR